MNKRQKISERKNTLECSEVKKTGGQTMQVKIQVKFFFQLAHNEFSENFCKHATLQSWEIFFLKAQNVINPA